MKTIKLLLLMSLWTGIVSAQEEYIAVAPHNKGEIVEKIITPAEFIEGGVNGFEKQVVNIFNINAVDEWEHLTYEQKMLIVNKIRKKEPVEDIVLWTEVVFVVELDGTLSQVKAEGPNNSYNREAERAIKSIQGKWKPAKRDGIPVRARYRIPIRKKYE